MTPPIYIALVDADDNITGSEEKMRVHQLGLLHRAFSILIFNQAGQLLIHQRALHKYHSGGLWTNTCCGHPNADEPMEIAVHRRLQEEMGFDCSLRMAFKFHYRADFLNGLIENEIDHVYIGQYDEAFTANPEEVAACQWVNVADVIADAAVHPDNYTYWFRVILQLPDFQDLRFEMWDTRFIN